MKDQSKDKLGRAYAKVADIKVGSVLETDGYFTCMPCSARKIVHEGDEGELYIECTGEDDTPDAKPCERHSLDGQISDDGLYYVGLYPV